MIGIFPRHNQATFDRKFVGPQRLVPKDNTKSPIFVPPAMYGSHHAARKFVDNTSRDEKLFAPSTKHNETQRSHVGAMYGTTSREVTYPLPPTKALFESMIFLFDCLVGWTRFLEIHESSIFDEKFLGLDQFPSIFMGFLSPKTSQPSPLFFLQKASRVPSPRFKKRPPRDVFTKPWRVWSPQPRLKSDLVRICLFKAKVHGNIGVRW